MNKVYLKQVGANTSRPISSIKLDLGVCEETHNRMAICLSDCGVQLAIKQKLNDIIDYVQPDIFEASVHDFNVIQPQNITTPKVNDIIQCTITGDFFVIREVDMVHLHSKKTDIHDVMCAISNLKDCSKTVLFQQTRLREVVVNNEAMTNMERFVYIANLDNLNANYTIDKRVETRKYPTVIIDADDEAR